MRIKSKLIALGLVSLMSISMLVGCGKSGSSKSELSLSEGTAVIKEETGLSFDLESKTKENFTIHGKTEDLSEPFYYNSTMITKSLVGDKDMFIKYNADFEHTLVLYADKSEGTINVNDKDYDLAGNQVFSLEIPAGDVKVTTKDVNLYYILVTNVNHTIEVELPGGSAIAFNTDDVEIQENKDGSVIYTFYDKAQLKVNKDGTTEVIYEGDYGLLNIAPVPSSEVEEATPETEAEIESDETVEVEASESVEEAPTDDIQE